MTIRVLIADDDVFMRQGLRVMLQSEHDVSVVAEADNGRQAVERAVALGPDVVLIDLMMPAGDGIEATRAIAERCAGTRVLVLTEHADEALFLRAVQAGAAGYVLKDVAPADLAHAIRTVHEGRTMLSPCVARHMLSYLSATATRARENPDPAGRPYGLTCRDIEILAGVARGLGDREIARRCYLSESTVKAHLRRIYQRLKLRNRAQAAAFAVEKGLLRSS